MGLIGGYDLHLYCDSPEPPAREATFHLDAQIGSGFQDFAGRNERDAMRAARRAGWLIIPRGEGRPGGNGIGRAICPTCRKRGVR